MVLSQFMWSRWIVCLHSPMLFVMSRKLYIMLANARRRNRLVSLLAVTALFLGSDRVCLALGTDGSQAILVKVVKTANGYQLQRGGKPYFIKGAGGSASWALLAKRGGNSVRTWGADHLNEDLVEANRSGLTVTAGIWLGHKDQGFDYSDTKAVQEQFNNAKAIVERYKDSPNLLVWALGNEMEGYDSTTDPKMWNAVENLAKMVHQVDPNHPTMTVIAEVGGDKVTSLHKYCPDIDIVGINSYGGLPSIAKRYAAAGGTKPYVITEFGPAGTWERPKNSWGAVPEQTSTEKAQVYADGYRQAIADQPLCLGSYAFTWGAKQEATATWFGMLLPSGERLGAVDALQKAWTNKAPVDPCPTIVSLHLAGSDQLSPGASCEAGLKAASALRDPLRVQWKLVYDPVSYHVGGGAEMAAQEFPSAIVSSDNTHAVVKMPAYKGGYRLYAFVYDQHHGAAVGNIPLYVATGAPPPPPPAFKAALPFVVVGDTPAANDFIPSGYMGNTGAITMNAGCADSPHSGKSCLQVDYTATDGWGGVVWQLPANDWGDTPGGFDLTGASRLSFWARGAHGGETVSFSFGLIKSDKPFHDSASGNLESVTLPPQWKEYFINLAGKDLSYIKTGFCWVVSSAGKPVRFYLDDIHYQ